MAGPQAPDFVERLESKCVRQGESVILTAVVAGNPEPVVRWFREGMEIESMDDFVISVEGQKHSLTIAAPYPEGKCFEKIFFVILQLNLMTF